MSTPAAARAALAALSPFEQAVLRHYAAGGWTAVRNGLGGNGEPWTCRSEEDQVYGKLIDEAGVDRAVATIRRKAEDAAASAAHEPAEVPPPAESVPIVEHEPEYVPEVPPEVDEPEPTTFHVDRPEPTGDGPEYPPGTWAGIPEEQRRIVEWRRASLVEHLREQHGGNATVAELAEGLGQAVTIVRDDVRRLVEAGQLVKTDDYRRGRAGPPASVYRVLAPDEEPPVPADPPPAPEPPPTFAEAVELGRRLAELEQQAARIPALEQQLDQLTAEVEELRALVDASGCDALDITLGAAVAGLARIGRDGKL